MESGRKTQQQKETIWFRRRDCLGKKVLDEGWEEKSGWIRGINTWDGERLKMCDLNMRTISSMSSPRVWFWNGKLRWVQILLRNVFKCRRPWRKWHYLVIHWYWYSVVYWTNICWTQIMCKHWWAIHMCSWEVLRQCKNKTSGSPQYLIFIPLF